jgi:hypothetical protein
MLLTTLYYKLRTELKINIGDALKAHKSYTEAGNVLYEKLKEAISIDGRVTADMTGVSALPSLFVNVSIGRIIDEYDVDVLKRSIIFKNITRKQAERLKDYLTHYTSPTQE